MGGQWYDANISIPGCDKNMPGVLMAMGRVNRPSLMVYGGTIQPGRSCGGDKLDLVSAFQSYGEYVSGAIDENKRYDIIRHACPGPGACGGSKCELCIRTTRVLILFLSVHCQHNGLCS
jgi:dihydroxy-acid dehydratase